MIRNRKFISFLALSLLTGTVSISYSMQSAGSSLAAKTATAMMAHAKSLTSPVQTIVEGTKTTPEVTTGADLAEIILKDNFCIFPIDKVTADPSWIAMSSGHTAAEITAMLAAGTPVAAAGAFAIYGAKKAYDKAREQKLLNEPQTVYQLASLHDDPLLLSDGGNAGDGGNNGNARNNHSENSFFKRHRGFIMPIAFAAAYQLRKSDKNSDENKLEKLIDCMQKPDATIFGSNGNEYSLWTHKWIFDKNDSQYEKFIGPKNNKIFKFITATFLNQAKPTTPDSITLKPYMFLHNTKPKDLLAEVSRELNAQADKNDRDYVYTYSDAPVAESAGFKPKNFYPVDAGKHGTYQCHRTYNNIGNEQQVDGISCLDQQTFEKVIKYGWIVPFSRTKKA